MGKVIAEVHIMPVGVETNLEEIIEKMNSVVPDTATLKDTKIEPVAFGLKKIIASVIVNDAEGATETIESSFSGISGVEEVRIERVTLL
jgi:elongation factor 1-beta